MNKSFAAAVLLPAGVLALAGPACLVYSHYNHHDPAVHTATADPAPAPLWTCGMHPQVVQDHPGTCPICHMRLTPMHSAADHHHGGPPAVVIDAAVVQNMGVRTAVATRGPVVHSLRTIGTLEAPETGLHDISPRVGGWIVKLYANQEGQHIHLGDPLFDLYSPDLLAAGGELVGAARAVRGLGPATDVSVRRSAEALLASAKRRLALLDVPDAQIESIADTLAAPKTFTFRSPASGAVVDKAVVEGSAITAGMKLMRIEDHAAIWLDLQVYEDQMAAVAVGQAVEATVEGLPGQTFRGTVTFVHPHVDHMSRTMVARVALQNGDGSLRPGMYASALIVTRPVEDAVQVPREAVIDTGTRQVAFLALAAGHFEPRDVRMGITGDDGRVQILSGLEAGDTVVTSGQFLLDVESRTTEAVEKLRAGPGSEMAMAAPAAPPTTTPMAPPLVASTLPAMAEMAADRPRTLTIAYCPMKKARWVQEGDTLANPYFGTAMTDCGEVRRRIPFSEATSPVGVVTAAYLRVEKGLASDKLDAEAVAALRAAAERAVDPALADLRTAAHGVTSAGDLTASRVALKALSESLIRTTDAAASPTTAPAGGQP
jgi:RND family efflux transporter MFP subunit